MAKGWVLSTGYLPQGGLPRNSVDRITDRPDMTSAVDRGRKASTQTKNLNLALIFYWFFTIKRSSGMLVWAEGLTAILQWNENLLKNFFLTLKEPMDALQSSLNNSTCSMR